ncbi:MAG: HAD hydrolase family protein [bacterium]
MLILDVDGVLTNGGIVTGSTDEGVLLELKIFNSQDGLGLRLVRNCGIELAIVSGRESMATKYRAKELGISECHQDPSGIKLPIVEQILLQKDYGWNSVCMIGDDLVDLPILQKAALPVAVANAVPEIKDVCKLITDSPGGSGAVREVCEWLIKARDQWDKVLDDFCQSAS